ncbi:hypothetical protein [Lacticaseibacillus porcinae]|uniref:hypothetical protein n=1 Tax=Lacticaseibacillus porcinae TaxID=1123687 RepID=UPI000F7B21F4|nr:hypothetical protein [Lacticaseibacillus porcinae]
MDDEPKTRKAYREAQKHAQATASERDKKRVEVERDYAREQRKKKRGKMQPNGQFDDITYKRVTGLKKKLNWAIGIVFVLIVIVFLVLAFV